MIDVELVILGVGIHHIRMPDHANIGKLFQECTARVSSSRSGGIDRRRSNGKEM